MQQMPHGDEVEHHTDPQLHYLNHTFTQNRMCQTAGRNFNNNMAWLLAGNDTTQTHINTT